MVKAVAVEFFKTKVDHPRRYADVDLWLEQTRTAVDEVNTQFCIILGVVHHVVKSIPVQISRHRSRHVGAGGHPRGEIHAGQCIVGHNAEGFADRCSGGVGGSVVGGHVRCLREHHHVVLVIVVDITDIGGVNETRWEKTSRERWRKFDIHVCA